MRVPRTTDRHRVSTTAGARVSRIRDLPRRTLVVGEGALREVSASWGRAGELQWRLQLLELRSPVGIASLPVGAVHLLAGVSGPQVGIGPAPFVGLPKEQVLIHSGPDLEFRRPGLRANEPSRVAVLSVVRGREGARLVFEERHGRSDLPPGTVSVIVRAGSVGIDGVRAEAADALILPGSVAASAEAQEARVLLVIAHGDAIL